MDSLACPVGTDCTVGHGGGVMEIASQGLREECEDADA